MEGGRMSQERPRVLLHDIHVTGVVADESAVRAAVERAVIEASGRGRLDAESLRAQISAHLAGEGLGGLARQGLDGVAPQELDRVAPQGVDGVAGQEHAGQEVPRRGTP